ncbi:ATP-binding protein [Streptomyces sp. NPDC050625]|uniref:ATP-binding protein n=1 Tax=Streptomyces sp. NPDC050625 TaxID=3154629 RepID=UPI00341C5F15
MPAQETRVGTARQFASRLLKNWPVSTEQQDTAVLIVSELAANAARHGLSDMTLHLTLKQDTLHIEMTDWGTPRLPRQHDREVDPDEHGRGMDIVAALSTSVTTLPSTAGWHVHASLSVRTHG